MEKIGIVLNCIGTIMSFYGFLSTDKNAVGTWEELYRRKDDFKKEYPIMCSGIILIIFGAMLQIL